MAFADMKLSASAIVRAVMQVWGSTTRTVAMNV